MSLNCLVDCFVALNVCILTQHFEKKTFCFLFYCCSMIWVLWCDAQLCTTGIARSIYMTCAYIGMYRRVYISVPSFVASELVYPVSRMRHRHGHRPGVLDADRWKQK